MCPKLGIKMDCLYKHLCVVAATLWTDVATTLKQLMSSVFNTCLISKKKKRKDPVWWKQRSWTLQFLGTLTIICMILVLKLYGLYNKIAVTGWWSIYGRPFFFTIWTHTKLKLPRFVWRCSIRSSAVKWNHIFESLPKVLTLFAILLQTQLTF